MKIVEIFKDIVQDMLAVDVERQNRDRERFAKNLTNRRNSGPVGFYYVIFPQIVGFVAGLALTKILGMGGDMYVFFGVLFALLGGIYKSVSFDKIGLMPAIVRNIIITLMILGFVLIIVKTG